MPRAVHWLGVSLAASLAAAGAWRLWAPQPLPQGPGWAIQVSARHLEAGEAAWARLAAPGSFTATVRFRLRNAQGVVVWRAQTAGLNCARHAPAGTAGLCLTPAQPFALPAPGPYRLSVRVEERRWSERLTAVPAPAPYYGGVLPVQTLGLPGKVRNYLRAHGFAVRHGLHGAATRLIVAARTRLPQADYLRLWRETANGGHLLLLKTPDASAARDWPFRSRITPWSAACDSNFFPVDTLARGLPPAFMEKLLRPAYGFDLRQQDRIVPRSLSGRMLAIGRYRAPRLQCRPLFAFRFGQGAVIASSLPVLEHFPDAWARRYFMNLLKAAAQRQPPPAAPGLAAFWLRRLRRAAPKSTPGH